MDLKGPKDLRKRKKGETRRDDIGLRCSRTLPERAKNVEPHRFLGSTPPWERPDIKAGRSLVQVREENTTTGGKESSAGSVDEGKQWRIREGVAQGKIHLCPKTINSGGRRGDLSLNFSIKKNKGEVNGKTQGGPSTRRVRRG